ncbi:hypothetical protein [Bradyrhizobium sp. BTAi1]|uniref:hypothetical protein n=1 Tax=Bradyrhizobium sp. (strain BTAi1 / ATCC BAA-1182) TaxID=288000 RepID=UPI000151958A|nr:hypothetical protein [Bradyrhizobium sp. BTAi1]ABQ35706.1 hypothetical protein BBta_3619 [Bradyrhizobium sp. BTAi1]
MRDLILRNLAAAIEPKLLADLLTNYENLVARAQRGDLDGALAASGKFVEHTLRTVEFIRSGTAPPEIKSALQTVKDIEKDGALPEGLRLLVPRIAHSMIYDVRSKRGAIHVKEVDPRAIDVALSVQAASWVVAELLRQFHSDDEASVNLALQNLMRPHIPFIEQFGDEFVVTRKVSADCELLLLLARVGPVGLDRTALGQAAKLPPPTVTRTLTRLEDARHIHKARDGNYHITGPGEQHLHSLINGSDKPRSVRSRKRRGVRK